MWRGRTGLTGGVLLAAIALGTTGCATGGSSKSSSTGDPASGSHTPPQACLDMADAVAQAAERCNLGSYDENHAAFISAAANGDCNNVVDLRDEAALYKTCIPSFKDMSCAELSAGTLDPTCSKQLLHT